MLKYSANPHIYDGKDKDCHFLPRISGGLVSVEIICLNLELLKPSMTRHPTNPPKVCYNNIAFVLYYLPLNISNIIITIFQVLENTNSSWL
jgi:hypothetical protein